MVADRKKPSGGDCQIYTLDPAKVPAPGEPGFRFIVPREGVLVTHAGQMFMVKAGDIAEWDGEKVIVNGRAD